MPAKATAPPPTAATPKQVGDYLVDRELGRGAFGVVYRARHKKRPDTPVALKVVEGRGNTDRLMLEPAVLASAVSLSARSDSNCWPFGAVPKTMSTLDPPAASVEVQLGYGTGVSGVANSYTLCLSNLVG